MGARKTLWCFLLAIITLVVVVQANLFEVGWNDEVFEETVVTDDSVGRSCPKYEHYDECKGSCDKTCDDYNENPGVCPTDCKPGCICNRRYVRGPDGTCIKPKKCPLATCPPGEHHDKCLLNCQRDCSNWNSTHFTCADDCTPGCVCDEGTVRSSLPNGECVKPEECKVPKEREEPQRSLIETEGLPFPFLCSKKHEEYSFCRSFCPDNCTNYQDNRRACNIACLPILGCVCKSGYVKGPNGDCIKPDQCSTDKPQRSLIETEGLPFPFLCSKTKHEVYSICPSLCADNCTNYQDNRRACNIACLPIPGCVCKSGYVKGPNGDCIKPDQCPTDKKPEDCTDLEQYTTCLPCGETCDNYREKDIDCGKQCRVGCSCLPGYVRGPKGDCIFPFDCPATSTQRSEISDEETEEIDNSEHKIPEEKESTRVKPEDCTELEHYSTCLPCGGTCDTYRGKKIDCGKQCRVGCFCLPGYVRGPEGDCILPIDCPATSSQRSEIYDEATEEEIDNSEYEIPEEKESTRDPKYDKKIPDEVTDNSEVEFQEEKDDPRVFPQSLFCRKNEQFSVCPSLCPDNCTNYQDKLRPCKVICLPLPGCVCKRGYVIGPDGTCVKTEKCHKVQKPEDCLDDQYYDTCGSSCAPDCKNYNSDDLNCDRKCNIGCFCRPGMVKGPNGKCIWPFECEVKASNSGEDAQTYGCPSSYSCRRHCIRMGGRGGYCVGFSFCVCPTST